MSLLLKYNQHWIIRIRSRGEITDWVGYRISIVLLNLQVLYHLDWHYIGSIRRCILLPDHQGLRLTLLLLFGICHYKLVNFSRIDSKKDDNVVCDNFICVVLLMHNDKKDDKQKNLRVGTNYNQPFPIFYLTPKPTLKSNKVINLQLVSVSVQLATNLNPYHLWL